MSTGPELPAEVLALAARGPAWAEHVAALPRLLRELLAEWELRPDGPSLHGHTAVVLPVRDASGVEAMLKVVFPHDEAEHEALALQRWRGRGAVRLLRADPRRWALLLERARPVDLTGVEVHAACEIAAGLYAALHVPALPQLRTLASYVGPGLDQLAALPRSTPLPHRLVEQAVAAGRDLLTDPGAAASVIHTDLHYENVLASARDESAEPWLVIDPKPLAGDPHYEVAPLLWNRWEEMPAGGSVRGAVRRRFHAVVDAAPLDEHRARDWVVVRMLLNAAEELTEPTPDAEWITRMLTIAKAVQD